VRAITKKISLLLLLLVVLYLCGRFLDKSLGGIYDDARAPYLQMPTPHSIVMRWQTRQSNIGVVRIGKSNSRVDQLFVEQQADDEHSVLLTGLQPNTRYYYRVGTAGYTIYEGKDYWFKTPPQDDLLQEDSSQPIRFWVTGDQGQAGDIQNNVRDAMLGWIQQHTIGSDSKSKPDFWLTTGDNAYRSGTNQQFQDNFFTPYKQILRNTPVWPIYGNHDARRWTFYNIFSFPSRAEVGGLASGTEKYFSFNYSNLHVVVLDSQSSRIQPNSRMLRWLEKDLAINKQRWLVAAFHHPPYTRGTHHSDNPADSLNRMQNIRRYVLPILEQAGVDVVLTGHSHMYERSWFMKQHYGLSSTFSAKNIQDRKPSGNVHLTENRISQKGLTYRKQVKPSASHSGTIYITLGSSARLDQGDLDHPAMPVSLHESGSMVFDIVNNTLSANFINDKGELKDSFTIVKDVN